MGLGHSCNVNLAKLARLLTAVLAWVLQVAPVSASEPMAPPKVVGEPASQIRNDFAILRNLTVYYNLLVWPAGRPITVCFFAEQADLRQTFVDAARQWEATGAIVFDFGSEPGFRTCLTGAPANIRVRFSGTLMGITAGNSAIGTTSLRRKPEDPTLNIASRSPYDGEARRREALVGTIVHEIGHALGLPHEHQHPESVCLNEHLYAAICAQAPRPGIDARKNAELQRKRVDLYRMLPRRIDPVPPWSLPYDVHSIMHYQFQPRNLRGGERSSCYSREQRQISAGDRARMALLYPRPPGAQRAYLQGQIEVFRKTMKAMGLSEQAAQRLAIVVERPLHLAHGVEGLRIRADDLGLTKDDTSELEDLFANPIPPPLPEACKEPVFQPLPSIKPKAGSLGIPR